MRRRRPCAEHRSHSSPVAFWHPLTQIYGPLALIDTAQQQNTLDITQQVQADGFFQRNASAPPASRSPQSDWTMNESDAAHQDRTRQLELCENALGPFHPRSLHLRRSAAIGAWCQWDFRTAAEVAQEGLALPDLVNPWRSLTLVLLQDAEYDLSVSAAAFRSLGEMVPKEVSVRRWDPRALKELSELSWWLDYPGKLTGTTDALGRCEELLETELL